MKIIIFLPDGVGLKNFAFTEFYKIGKQFKHKVLYWNNTPFPLNETFGFDSIQVPKIKSNPISDLYKRAKIRIELNLNFKETKDKTYLSYLFPQSYKGIKNILKTIFVNILVLRYSSRKGLRRVISKMYDLEKNSILFKESLKQLKDEKPNFVFCTNQRPIAAIAPLLAAHELGIPTATFIFSWDNLPKATLLVKTDYYFVWSSFMKDELLKYAPFIKENQIKITGTPQFEPHYKKSSYLSKTDFFDKYALNINKKYICFSGDDPTTSPNDEYYLEDVAKAVREMNFEGANLGVVFRKCPVDFTGRYDSILKEYSDVISVINPLWEQKGEGWNAIMPQKEDLQLLTNTCLHTEMVFNVASSTVFDFVIHKHPCAYLNYKTIKVNDSDWTSEKVYNFIHFKSMPTSDAVMWINSTDDIKKHILKTLRGNFDLKNTEKWYDLITTSPQNKASKNIWKAIDEIV